MADAPGGCGVEGRADEAAGEGNRLAELDGACFAELGQEPEANPLVDGGQGGAGQAPNLARGHPRADDDADLLQHILLGMAHPVKLSLGSALQFRHGRGIVNFGGVGSAGF